MHESDSRANFVFGASDGSGTPASFGTPDVNGREEGEEADEPMVVEDEAEAAMMAMMGFGGFDSTKVSQRHPMSMTMLRTTANRVNRLSETRKVL